MQQPQMIVLGLISQGIHYGFEMERFIDKTKMRLWARIGKSTIYKALRDLLLAGDLSEKRQSAERGPGKVVFSLTPSVRQTLIELVRDALRSTESVYSDRIAGLVFASSLPPNIAAGEIETCILNLETAIESIEAERDVRNDKPVANIVLNFYRKVYLAEREAMVEMKDLVRMNTANK